MIQTAKYNPKDSLHSTNLGNSKDTSCWALSCRDNNQGNLASDLPSDRDASLVRQQCVQRAEADCLANVSATTSSTEDGSVVPAVIQLQDCLLPTNILHNTCAADHSKGTKSIIVNFDLSANFNDYATQNTDYNYINSNTPPKECNSKTLNTVINQSEDTRESDCYTLSTSNEQDCDLGLLNGRLNDAFLHSTHDLLDQSEQHDKEHSAALSRNCNESHERQKLMMEENYHLCNCNEHSTQNCKSCYAINKRNRNQVDRLIKVIPPLIKTLSVNGSHDSLGDNNETNIRQKGQVPKGFKTLQCEFTESKEKASNTEEQQFSVAYPNTAREAGCLGQKSEECPTISDIVLTAKTVAGNVLTMSPVTGRTGSLNTEDAVDNPSSNNSSLTCHGNGLVYNLVKKFEVNVKAEEKENSPSIEETVYDPVMKLFLTKSSSSFTLVVPPQDPEYLTVPSSNLISRKKHSPKKKKKKCNVLENTKHSSSAANVAGNGVVLKEHKQIISQELNVIKASDTKMMPNIDNFVDKNCIVPTENLDQANILDVDSKREPSNTTMSKRSNRGVRGDEKYSSTKRNVAKHGIYATSTDGMQLQEHYEEAASKLTSLEGYNYSAKLLGSNVQTLSDVVLSSGIFSSRATCAVKPSKIAGAGVLVSDKCGEVTCTTATTTHTTATTAPVTTHTSVTTQATSTGCCGSTCGSVASSVLSVVEEYLYTDKPCGVVLVERRGPTLSSNKG